MNFYERYIQYESIALIRIIENRALYTKECIDVIEEILADKNICFENNEDDILLVNREIARKTIQNFNPLKKKIPFHKSYFLDEKAVKDIYKAELLKHIQKHKHFGFDVWSYAIGGFKKKSLLSALYF